MTLCTLILLGLVVGEVVVVSKLSRQGARIDKLEGKTAKEKK